MSNKENYPSRCAGGSELSGSIVGLRPAAVASARAESVRKRWWLFAVLTLLYVLVCFYRVSMAVVAGDITRELKLSPAQLGTLSSVLLYVYALAQLPLGPMIDRLGSRTMICGCGVLASIGGILFSQADTLSCAMTARVLIGLGTASVLMATFTIFSRWFSHQEFGRVSGLMIAIGNLGNLSATIPLALSVAAIGWRSSFLVIGIAQLLITLLVFGVVRDRPAGKKGESAAKEESKPAGMLEAWREVFGQPDFWLLGVICFFQYGNALALQGLWGGPYLVEVLHLSTASMGRLLLLSALGSVIGALFIDTVARKLFRSYKKTLICGQLLFLMFMSGFLGIIELLPPSILHVYFFTMGLVAASGVLSYPVIRSMFPVRVVGTALTSINFFVLMGAAVTQQVMGFIMEAFAGGSRQISPQVFHAAFLFPIIGLACAIALYSLARDYMHLQG